MADNSAPAAIVYEDADVIALAAPRPLHAGHCLVMPRAHVITIAALDPRVATHLWLVALTVERAIANAGMREQGLNILLAEGPAAGQSDDHVRLHLVPRETDDDWSSLELERPIVEQRMLDRVARLLRDSLL